MRHERLVLVLLVTACSGGFAAGQTVLTPAVHDSRNETPAVVRPESALEPEAQARIRQTMRAQIVTLLAARRNTCYAMRSYEFAKDDAGSGTPKQVGYTTCQAAAGIRMKRADEAVTKGRYRDSGLRPE